MKNETENARLYAEIMQTQATPAGRKRVTLARIGVQVEEITAFSRSRGCTRAELAQRVAILNANIKRLCTMHNVTREELREYFERNHYALSFKL